MQIRNCRSVDFTWNQFGLESLKLPFGQFWRIVKIGSFCLLQSLILISRKIWKLKNSYFHTLKQSFSILSLEVKCTMQEKVIVLQGNCQTFVQMYPKWKLPKATPVITDKSQFGNFKISLSFRFYVKSILRIPEVQSLLL